MKNALMLVFNIRTHFYGTDPVPDRGTGEDPVPVPVAGVHYNSLL